MNVRKLAKNQVKNRRASYVVAAVTAVASAAVIFARCNGSGAGSEGIVLNEPVRGDKVCEQQESYPYMRNPDGTVKMEGDSPVINIYYSKEDCYKGDNVCDNDKEVKDPAGNKVQDLLEKYVDGSSIKLPLEEEDSPDCVMAKAMEEPCGKLDSGKEIKRHLVSFEEPYLRQRTQKELESLYSGEIVLGDNYFVTISHYEETCDKDLPLCSPEINAKCFCENHVDCAPAPIPTCGNGKFDSGEQCDITNYRGKNACGESYYCNTACRCIKKIENTPEPKPEPKLEPKPEPKPQPSGQCPPGIQDSTLRSRVASNISSNSAQIRAAASGGSAPMTAFVSVNISGSGVPTIAGSSVRCGSSSCPSPVSPASVSSLSLGGIVVGGMEGKPCTKSYGATVK